MPLTIDNAISVYNANMSNQASYFNFYSGVSFGLLAFLGTATSLSVTAKCAALGGYALFIAVNGYVIWTIQANLLTIANDLRAANQDGSGSFVGTLATMKAWPRWQVGVFLVVSDLVFLGLMWKVSFGGGGVTE